MGYETCTCAYCGRREAMDLSRDVRFAGEYGPLCDDCLPLALRVVEANAADAADAANAPADPALLALARLGAMVISGYLRQNDTAELCLMAGLTEETPAGHAHRFPGIIDAIAALLAPDGAESVVAP